MNDMVVHEIQRGALVSAADILTQVKIVQEVMQAVMRQDIHYGVIPGTEKPSLWKPGAEVLCAVFRIADSYFIEDLSSEDCIRYRVTCKGTHQTTGILMGEGIGECSSNEKKYKWMKAYQREWDSTPENRRRKVYGWNKTKKEEYEILQVRTDPADLANTVLKMAAKRAKIAMTLNVTAASDIFAQDLEDLDERLRNIDNGRDEEAPTLDPVTEADLIAGLDKVADNTDKLREALKHALSVAHDAGDIEAHKRIKAHAVELQKKLAAKANGEGPTDEQIIGKLSTAKDADACDLIADSDINPIADETRRKLLLDVWRKRKGALEDVPQ